MNISKEHRAILESPCCSFWLRNAYKEAIKRDCVDAVHDAELLASMLVDRLKAIQGGN